MRRQDCVYGRTDRQTDEPKTMVPFDLRWGTIIQRANSVDQDEAAQYELPHLDLQCLKIQLCSRLLLSVLMENKTELWLMDPPFGSFCECSLLLWCDWPSSHSCDLYGAE